VIEFNRAIVEATSDLVCAYKPNVAFYEALGAACFETLRETVKCVPGGIPIIGDAKRSDIGNTASAYARALFDTIGFDAVTVNPYLGFDSVEPFLQYQDRGVFILCRTSNEGALDFQSLHCEAEPLPDTDMEPGQLPLYEIVALKAHQWNVNNNIGLVVGATYSEELGRIRASYPAMPLLIPGVGAQGGDLAAAVNFGVDRHGELAVINSSRQIIYASREKDFAAAARKAAEGLRLQINHHRTTLE
jgi:orotidine-5'-phosphate decarboxylase